MNVRGPLRAGKTRRSRAAARGECARARCWPQRQYRDESSLLLRADLIVQ